MKALQRRALRSLRETIENGLRMSSFIGNDDEMANEYPSDEQVEALIRGDVPGDPQLAPGCPNAICTSQAHRVSYATIVSVRPSDSTTETGAVVTFQSIARPTSVSERTLGSPA